MLTRLSSRPLSLRKPDGLTSTRRNLSVILSVAKKPWEYSAVVQFVIARRPAWRDDEAIQVDRDECGA